ncbi:hypothetical protein [Azospirillum sp. B506]|uniref:hypothetical protein n=1 Tax=Azospirillum sp. B506 TaxID=137721 RepID=UPI0003458736|nr:hypothetical protein [Azospirillum sp. B506]
MNHAASAHRPSTDPTLTHSVIFSALAAKRAELDARRLQLSEQMAVLEQDLASLEGAMRLFVAPADARNPDSVPDSLPSFRRGEIGLEAITILQTTSYPLSTQEIAKAICIRRLVTLEREAFTALGQMIVAGLRRAEKQGLVHEVGRTGRRALLWFAPTR